MTTSTTILSNYGSLLQETCSSSRTSEDKARARKRAAECLDTAVTEYIKFAMPTGFKDWTPDLEHMKSLQPLQRMVGFVSAPEKLKLRRNHRRSYYRDDDKEEEKIESWCPTSLFRLMRLGMVTPMVGSAGIHDHNMRAVFAGLFDSFLTAAQDVSASYVICSFQLPDYKKILAEDYTSKMRVNIHQHGLMLQSLDYETSDIKVEALDSRLKSLEVFLKGSTGWMMLDLPIGGGETGQGFTKFPYAFGTPIRTAHRLVDDLLQVSVGGRYYSSGSPVLGTGINPKSYSGIHQEVTHVSPGGDKLLEQQIADLRPGVLMALLFPGLLVDHGVIAAHVISKSRDGASIADPRGVTIKTVDNNQQETVWNNNIVNCRNASMVPDPFTGRILTLPGDSSVNTSNVPLELLNTQDIDHQDLMDSIFGLGYVRCLTSKRIGHIVRDAIQCVLAAKTPEALLVVYETYRDALNMAAPLGFYKGKDAVELALGVGVSRPNMWDSDKVIDYLKLVDPEVQFTNSWFLRRAVETAYPGASPSVAMQTAKAVAEAYVLRETKKVSVDAAMAAAEGAIVL